jgi:hypothetical protein
MNGKKQASFAACQMWDLKDIAMENNLKRASDLVLELQRLAKQAAGSDPNLPRGEDAIAIDQLAVFGDLLVVLARYVDRAQSIIKWLTLVLTVLTAVLVIDAGMRWFVH